MQEELLPQVAEWAPHSRDPATLWYAARVLAACLRCMPGLHWPQCFGGVISQSGSFWWPRRDMYQHEAIPADAGWLLHQVEQGVGRKGN